MKTFKSYQETELEEGSSDTTDMYKLMIKGMKQVPGSAKQKETIKQINVIRKRLGMALMKEGAEYPKTTAAKKAHLDKIMKRVDQATKKREKKFGVKIIDRTPDWMFPKEEVDLEQVLEALEEHCGHCEMGIGEGITDTHGFHNYPKRNKVGDEIEKLASKGGAEADKLFVIATALQKGRIPNKFIRELSPKRKKEVHAIMKDFKWKILPEDSEWAASKRIDKEIENKYEKIHQERDKRYKERVKNKKEVKVDEAEYVKPVFSSKEKAQAKRSLGFSLGNKVKKYNKNLQKTKDSMKEIEKSNKAQPGIEEARKQYDIYHPTYSAAVQHAKDHTKKAHGFDVDQDSWEREITFGRRKPSAGQTAIKKVKLTKDGKSVKKRLHMQIYGMDSGKYELNKYVEDYDGPIENVATQILKEGNGLTKADIAAMAKKLRVPLTDIISWDYGSSTGGKEWIISLKGGSQLNYMEKSGIVKIPKSANPNMKALRDYLKNMKSIKGDPPQKIADVKLGKNYLIGGLENAFKLLSR